MLSGTSNIDGKLSKPNSFALAHSLRSTFTWYFLPSKGCIVLSHIWLSTDFEPTTAILCGSSTLSKLSI